VFNSDFTTTYRLDELFSPERVLLAPQNTQPSPERELNLEFALYYFVNSLRRATLA